MAHEKVMELVDHFINTVTKSEIIEMMDNQENDDEKIPLPMWMKLWSRHETIRENEAKRDPAVNACWIGNKSYQFRAPETDDLFDAVMIGRDDEKRVQDWTLPLDMTPPKECTVKDLCNQLKLSPQELGECYPCVVASVETRFFWAVENWFDSKIRTLATGIAPDANNTVPTCVNFDMTDGETVTTSNHIEIRENERIQALFILNRMKSIIPNQWARRTGRKVPNRAKTPMAMARKTARGQVKSGADLELPAPINRTFAELEQSWKRLLEPKHLMNFPPETEYDYAIVARAWLMEIESVMFGEAVKNLELLEEKKSIEASETYHAQRAEYENVATSAQTNDQKR